MKIASSDHVSSSGWPRVSHYRWVIETLIVLAVLSQNVSWLAPAPVLGPIMHDLRISLGAAGVVVSVIALCIALFSLFGAILSERIGPLQAMLAGLWILAVGEILSGYAPGFATLLACRVAEGVGFGLMVAPPATLVMDWFPSAEWPYVNMINALCFYAGLALVFKITVPIFRATGESWRSVFTGYGAAVAVVALAWTLLGTRRGTGETRGKPSAARERSTLPEALRDHNVRIFALGFLGALWVVQLYMAFLPEYFRLYRGLSLGEASALTAIVPFTGIFAAVGGGFGTGVVRLRKPFLWPLAMLTFLGCIGAITMSDMAIVRISLVAMGIGMAGVFAPATTLLMELPGMTPAKIGSAQALAFTCGYFGAFVSPFLGGTLAQIFELKVVMLGSLVFQVMAIVCLYLLPETGPGRMRTEAARAHVE